MNDSLLISIFTKGGFFVYPILVCSVIALTIFLKRFYLSSKDKVISRSLLIKVSSYLDSGDFDKAIAACERDNTVFSKLAVLIFINRNEEKQVVESVVQDEGERQIYKLSKSNEILGSLSNISTLLGLLGTISGMITVFKVISTQTVVDPPSLAGGISEALYTTAFGLLVAIPSYIGYKYLNSRIMNIAVELQEESKKLIDRIKN
tara:strand:+ start:1833 stop:2447 length:615 start_codon:yes stop_codon:yes gene_type:complete